MSLYDWVRNEGEVDRTPGLSYDTPFSNDESFVMLVRDIQYQDVRTGGYNKFPTLYDVAIANKGSNYIPVTDNSKLIQDPPKKQ